MIRHFSKKMSMTTAIKQFEVGDIVVIKGLSLSHGKMGKSIGLVFDVKKNELQILYMAPQIPSNHLYSIKITGRDLIGGDLPQDYFVMSDKVLLLQKDVVVQKLAKVSVEKIDEILRKMIHNIIDKHYNEVHRSDADFIPGKTYIRYSGRIYDAEEIKTLVDSSLDFWLTAGRFAKQFEEEFAKLLGVKYCILTNSGSSANLLAINALTSPKLGKMQLEPCDEIITTACAFPTTINPIIQNNLVPVFIDVDIGTYNIQADKIEAALSKKTKAIFLAHTLGNPFELDKVMAIAKKYNLWVIEDNCDSLGSKYNGQYTGTFGHIATYSFYPPHHITMGEGGALTTNNTDLQRLILSFRDWGRDCWCEPGCDNTCGRRFGWQLGTLPYGYDHKYIYSHIGYNLKITDMQAAIGVTQLRKLPEFIKTRKKNWRHLFEELKEYKTYFILPRPADNSDPSWFGFILTVKKDAPFSKNDIVNHLENNKIATRMLFAGNIVHQPCFDNVKYRIYGDLKNTDFIMNNTFWIGVYPGITNSMIDYIIDTFKTFVEKY